MAFHCIEIIQVVPPIIKEAFSILLVDSQVLLSFIQIKSISDTWSAFGGMTRDKSQFKVSPFANPLNKRNNFGNHNCHRRRSRRSWSHFYQFPSNRDFTFWNSYFDSFSSQIHKLFGKLKLGKNLPRNIRNRKFLPFLPRRSLCRLLCFLFHRAQLYCLFAGKAGCGRMWSFFSSVCGWVAIGNRNWKWSWIVFTYTNGII